MINNTTMFKPVMENDEVQCKTFAQSDETLGRAFENIYCAHFICLLCYKMAHIFLEYYSCQGKKEEKGNLLI